MNFDAATTDDSQLRRAVSGIGRSADYSIAVALFGVCLVAGATLWFLTLRDPGTVEIALPPIVAADPASSPDEKAAVEALQRRLDEKFDQIDQKRRVEEAQAERVRQTAAAQAAAEAAREAERVARQAAAKKATPPPARTTVSPAIVAPAKPTPPVPAPRIATAEDAPVVVVAPKRTDAVIDWTSCKQPAYPAESMKRIEEGLSIVSVDLDATGKVLDTRIAQSSGYQRLDSAALRAVARCRFDAATVNGESQASVATVKVGWSLGQRRSR